MTSERRTVVVESAEQLMRPTSRRSFLRALGVGGTMILLPGVFAACEDAPNFGTNPNAPTTFLDLSADTGIFNYLYALEQVDSAFYTSAIASPAFTLLSASEQEVILDLQKHELVHREFFRQLLGTAALPALAFDAVNVDKKSASRESMLRNAQLLEDTAVSAYNGAGKYLTTPANLIVAAKIASVEARHSAAIRDIRDASTGLLFAGDDVVNVNGLDVKAEPETVVASLNALNVIDGSLRIQVPPDPSKRSPDSPAPTPA
jgi:rubrerythrin